MAEAKRDHDWRVAAEMMALTANCHRDTKAKHEPFTPAEFHVPELQRKAAEQATRPRPTVDIDVLRRVFVKDKQR